MAEKKIGFFCMVCGSSEIRADAYAAWNIETQEWELVTVFDARDCEECGGEASIDEQEIE